MELRVGHKYRLGRKIGSGSFGDIYLGTNIASNEEVAIKLECVRTKHPQLHIESKIYRMMQGGVGIPLIKWCGAEGDYNVLVMDLLGPSLEDLFNFCSRKFSLKTVLLLADQMVSEECSPISCLAIENDDWFRSVVSILFIRKISFIEISNLVRRRQQQQHENHFSIDRFLFRQFSNGPWSERKSRLYHWFWFGQKISWCSYTSTYSLSRK